MKYTIDLTKGDEANFTGVFEETKTGTLPLTNESNATIDLTGASLRFTAKTTQATYGGANPFSVIGGVLSYDFTSFAKHQWTYELLVTLSDGFKFKLTGLISFK